MKLTPYPSISRVLAVPPTGEASSSLAGLWGGEVSAQVNDNPASGDKLMREAGDE